ncbi:hypothetical protein SAMN04487910_3526 [Aquimarina amphilecti]|uniref:Lipoprotein n=1 Tax=Aquimarina amphilecti TaxID=1038014 RepID=A0A1H7TNB3_AQUAM|nr:hypothetical protein [Aquimarina amphilecti]SEL86362.1 hypothetical protein SAMN04487910_3526 [Aquimarina amphilecti]
MKNQFLLGVLALFSIISCEQKELLVNNDNSKTESLLENKSTTGIPYAEVLITHQPGFPEFKKEAKRICFADYFDVTIQSVTQCNTNPNTEILRFPNTVLRPTNGDPLEADDEDEQKPPPLYLEFNPIVISVDQLSEAASECGLLDATEIINCDNLIIF